MWEGGLDTAWGCRSGDLEQHGGVREDLAWGRDAGGRTARHGGCMHCFFLKARGDSAHCCLALSRRFLLTATEADSITVNFQEKSQ